MVEYNFRFEMAVIKVYLAGKGGYRTLATRFGITNYSRVRKWVKVFETFGESGLERKMSHKTYSKKTCV